VFQSVSVSLWKGLPKLRSEKALTRWIETAARRQSERIASKSRRNVRDEDIPDGVFSETGPSVLEKVSAAEEEHRVRRGLERLGGRCQELLKLLYLEDPSSSYEEIARRLGLPRGSIGPTRGRCLEKLREILDKMS
jgi:RNA polymerase sigma factor (sigma-70 family)